MNSNLSRKLVIALVALSPSGLYAGELTVDVFSSTDVPAVARVKSGATSLVKEPDNGWSFDLKSQPVIGVPIEIDVDPLPSGYQSVPLHFLLPYFADRSNPYPLGTAVANDQTNDVEGVGPFIREMGRPKSTFRNSYLLYQRARLLWAARKEQLAMGRKENADDVSIAYWMLFAARDLASNYYFQPDDTVWQTADWLSGLPDKPRLYSGVSNGTISTLLDQLRAVDASTYESVIGRLEQDRGGDPDATCSRFKRLDKDFFEFTGPERSRIDSTGRLAIRIKESVTWCAAQIVMRGSASLTDEQKDALRTAVGAAREAISDVSAVSQGGRNVKLIKQNVQVIESYVGSVK
ncbi:hypothetical protein ELI36_19045 [Rhizobium ruizarguesonis]|uniref:hypothetical protein n=1 Tax=Rhizobium ruizarguesonis TaxID=2081791 RepID=UPI00102F4840|nr:hypothetical protein [Rhizobium ruizarguesonis]TAV34379.1 hypothetical protein ELI36_19045 [Rhizobium ruizarguesonis]